MKASARMYLRPDCATADRRPAMGMLRAMAGAALLAAGVQAATVIPGDARRGEQLFDTEQCVQCHSVNGHGGSSAPDLGRRVDRNFTPAVMASLMWNHAPDMWTAMQQAGHREVVADARNRPPTCSPTSSRRATSKSPETPARGKQALHRQALRRMPRHRLGQRIRGAAGGQMGIAGRSHRAGAADVEPRRQNAAGHARKRWSRLRSSPRRS